MVLGKPLRFKHLFNNETRKKNKSLRKNKQT